LVAHQLEQIGIESAGDFERRGQILVLFLADPADAVGDVDSLAHLVGPIGRRTVVDLARVEEHRAALHLGADDPRIVVFVGLLPLDEVAARHDAGRTVLDGEVGHRPHRVALHVVVQREREEVPGELVPVQGLMRLTRKDRDHLGEVQLVDGRLRQDVRGGAEDQRMTDQFATGG
jgi:hypothetical protein